ncbi:metabolite transport protein, putative [Talaromyces stipitatus ATCC 10500]|uniref:Metabolite transport protein, putative n=1 Tax=Talaromyces stipitatus (strain ATCC 10500 / CBS 375.48 / QM 6759 / NRRL 1006) TaxID=441959 RepID=B8MMD0_TALSN|nr:metabolite transport protein, putative [Talaromyces stipitatus ATCC 10500]EED13684.1 metabolite transport protein, putative [Talaromyces stipitatus ATCC 10500]
MAKAVRAASKPGKIHMLTPIDRHPRVLTSSIQSRLSNSILVREVVGMILFGLCIDRFGRRVGIILTTLFLVLQKKTVTGGQYTVYTAQALESADNGGESLQKRRGCLVAVSTNLAIVAGFTFSSIVPLIVIAAYNNKASDEIWRICFGIGIIFPLTIFFFRMRLLNSTLYTKHAIQHKVLYILALRNYWRLLLGGSMAWFLYDFVVYPFNPLAPTLVSGFSKQPTLPKSVDGAC